MAMVSDKLKQSLIGMNGYLKEKDPKKFADKWFEMKSAHPNKGQNGILLFQFEENKNEAMEFIVEMLADKPAKTRGSFAVASINERVPLGVPVVFRKSKSGLIEMNLFNSDEES